MGVQGTSPDDSSLEPYITKPTANHGGTGCFPLTGSGVSPDSPNFPLAAVSGKWEGREKGDIPKKESYNPTGAILWKPKYK